MKPASAWAAAKSMPNCWTDFGVTLHPSEHSVKIRTPSGAVFCAELDETVAVAVQRAACGVPAHELTLTCGGRPMSAAGRTLRGSGACGGEVLRLSRRARGGGPTRSEVEDAFRLFDVAGDGVISESEFTSIMVHGGPGCAPIIPKEAVAMFKRFDANGNGRVSHREFSIAFAFPKLPAHLRLGITIEGIIEWHDALPKDAKEQVNNITPKPGKPKFPTNEHLNGYVNQHFLMLEGKKDQLAHCERLRKKGSKHAGAAVVFMSWYLDTPIETLLAALESYLVVEGLPRKTTYFWICDFVIRQHDVKPDLKWLSECVAAVGRTALLTEPWDKPGALERAYCIQEVYATQLSGARFELAMSAAQESAFRSKLADYANGGPEYARAAFDRIDVSRATCRDAEEKERILDMVRSLDGGIDKCNENVRSLLKSKMEDRLLGSEGAKKVAAALEGSRLDSL